MKNRLLKLSDAELLKLGSHGNEMALSILFDKYFFHIYSFANRLIKNSDVAKEIAMDVMFKMWQKKDRLHLAEDQSLRPYMIRAAKNAVINFHKSKKLRTESISNTQLSGALAYDGTADAELNLKELENRVNKIVEGLPEQRRLVFCLSREDDMTYAEIAKKLNISVHTVRNQISASIAYVKGKLNDYRNQ